MFKMLFIASLWVVMAMVVWTTQRIVSPVVFASVVTGFLVWRKRAKS